MSDVTRTILVENEGQTFEISRYRLSRLDREGVGKTFDSSEKTEDGTFESRRVTIGSSPENDFVIDDPSVSRTHAEIVAEDGAFRLRDLDSKNGTWVEGMRVESIFIDEVTTIRFGLIDVSFTPTSDKVSVHISGNDRFGKLLGGSLIMREVFGILERVAPTEATVLIEGESGTGKELAAEAIHMNSPRKDGPFIVVDCSAISRDLIESELFGHVKGAFTGATSNRQGAFEAAAGGTLFLDELGELPLDLQPKLLRALEKRVIKPIGTNETIPTDVRIIAATNRRLYSEVKDGSFREDLYYRFNVIRVRIPPLRERPEDIPLLVSAFMTPAREMANRPSMEVSYSTMQKLKLQPWPGNVRELRNFVERAVLLTEGTLIESDFIDPPEALPHCGASDALSEAMNAAEHGISFKDAKERLLHAFEMEYWTTLLRRTNGNVSEVGRIADVHRKTVEYNLKKLDLSREDVLEEERSMRR